jgi:choloylglycine hydrolase
MCTAISDSGRFHLFGRTLDVECSFGEETVITPRNFRLDFLYEQPITTHFAINGIACVTDNYPLYYDAVNEAGLAIAGLNFPTNAVYREPVKDKYNVASFELIPWILSKAESTNEAVKLLQDTNVTRDSYSGDLPATPLHWIISDSQRTVTAEAVDSGLEIYENPFGVLTNNPQFPYHVSRLSDFMGIDSMPPKNTLCPETELVGYSGGMGAMGLPGDFSSSSRFVRAVFLKSHTEHEASEYEEINRFFHIMDSVSVPCGCSKNRNGKNNFTLYTSCINTATGDYYFTTYGNRNIRAVRLCNEEADSERLIRFSIYKG